MSRRLRLLIALAFLPALPACTTFFFQPQDRDLRTTPARYDLAYEDIWFSVAEDALWLHGWFLPARGDVRGTVLFLHGNADDIGAHLGEVSWLPRHGLNVFLFDYRGFGQSTGAPSVPGIARDIEAALGYLAGRADIGDGIVVYGQSLGGALAPHAITHSDHRHDVCALVLDSTFASFSEMTRDAIGDFWFRQVGQDAPPLQRLDAFTPLVNVTALGLPVLVVHSLADSVVPAMHAQQIYAAASAPKQLWLLPSGIHARTLRDPAQPDIRQRWLDYAFAVLKGRSPTDFALRN